MYEEEIHTSLTSELDAGEWLVLCLATVSQSENCKFVLPGMVHTKLQKEGNQC